MIPAADFTTDGRTALWLPTDDEFGTHVLLDTLRDEMGWECEAIDCRGGEVQYPEWEGRTERCPRCDGSGRYTFEVQVIDQPNDVMSYWVHIIDMLPVVKVPPGDGYPRRSFIMSMGDGTFARYTWLGEQGSTVWQCHGLVEAPLGARNGETLVFLSIHQGPDG